jgi:hypothetical protein
MKGHADSNARPPAAVRICYWLGHTELSGEEIRRRRKRRGTDACTNHLVLCVCASAPHGGYIIAEIFLAPGGSGKRICPQRPHCEYRSPSSFRSWRQRCRISTHLNFMTISLNSMFPDHAGAAPAGDGSWPAPRSKERSRRGPAVWSANRRRTSRASRRLPDCRSRSSQTTRSSWDVTGSPVIAVTLGSGLCGWSQGGRMRSDLHRENALSMWERTGSRRFEEPREIA